MTISKARIKQIVKSAIAQKVDEDGFGRVVNFSIDEGKFKIEMATIGDDLTNFLTNVAKAMGPEKFMINGTDYSLVYLRMLDSYLKSNGDSLRNSEMYPEEVSAARDLVDQAQGLTFLIAKAD